MCKYQIVNEDEAPMCIGTKELCTYCITSNMETYNANEKKQIPGINGCIKRQTTAGPGLHLQLYKE